MADISVSAATTSLLWESCRRDLELESIRHAANGDLQPSLLAGLALSNRLVPLLWRAMEAAGVEDRLEDERAHLSELATLFRMQALLVHPMAVSLAVGPLTAVGLEPVVMKGPAVASRYPEAGLRPMDDLDLLLPPEQHDRGLGALLAAGWTVSRPRGRGWYDTQLRHPEVPAMPLELHYGLDGWHERFNRLHPQWLWEQRVPMDCLGTAAFGLPLEVEVVSLAAHAGKPYHGFDRMIWLADLAMILTDAATISWDQVERLARVKQCVTVVNVALNMATRMGLAVPEGHFALPQTGWRAAPLQHLQATNWPVSPMQGRFHTRFVLADTTWWRLVLLAGSLHHASWSDRVHLPQRAASRVVDLWRHARNSDMTSSGVAAS
jgi:hypothetical protein